MPSDIALFIAILVIATLAYFYGHRDGYRKGRDSGYVSGHCAGQKRWIAAMEARRGPEGALLEEDRPALVRVVRD